MSYQSFIDRLMPELTNSCPPDTTPKKIRVIKNNDEELDCLIFVSNSQCYSHHPVIYLDSYYEEYCCGSDIKTIVSQIMLVLNQVCSSPVDIMSALNHFETVRDSICFKLISKKLNERLLRDTPYIPYLDLALTAICLFYDDKKDTSMSVLIKDSLLDVWGVTSKEVFAAAYKNSPRIMKPELINMNEIAGCSSLLFPMYVLTSAKKQFGAVCMTLPGVLKKISKKLQSDLLIIPSSIHETIIIPYSQNEDDKTYMNSTIRNVNTRLSKQDVLSSHCYIYDQETDSIYF